MYQKSHDVSLTNSSPFLTLEEPNIPGTQPDKIGSSNYCYFSGNVFTRSSFEIHSYLSFDPMKPPKFDDLLFYYSRTH